MTQTGWRNIVADNKMAKIESADAPTNKCIHTASFSLLTMLAWFPLFTVNTLFLKCCICFTVNTTDMSGRNFKREELTSGLVFRWREVCVIQKYNISIIPCDSQLIGSWMSVFQLTVSCRVLILTLSVFYNILQPSTYLFCEIFKSTYPLTRYVDSSETMSPRSFHVAWDPNQLLLSD